MKKIKGVYRRNAVVYIRYQNEEGELIRESTQQRSLKVAETILAQRKAAVAMRRNFPLRVSALWRSDRLLVDLARLPHA
ncbi:MAG: hypothetical protein JO323_00115 [Acidobacteriia bacterium]|nr:hypothetical protein [Terriglobia bacterium]